MGAVVKGSGAVTAQALSEAFVAFEGEYGRQPKVLAVRGAQRKAEAQAAINSGVVGGLTIELDSDVQSWELREAVRDDEREAADVAAVDGTVNAYPGLAAESGSHDPSRLSHPASVT